MSEKPKTSGGRRWLGLLRPLVAVAVLFFVARSLPWRDRLEWTAGGETVVLTGSIEGDWKLDQIAFQPDESTTAEREAWPASLREALGGGDLDVRRGEGEGGVAVDWKPGLPRAFGGMDPLGVASAMALFVTALLFGVTRWWRLLSLAGCRTRWTSCFRLTYLGLFFNIVVPGLTGGDLVKALMVTRENPQKRAEALVSVVVDRIIGLVVLTLLAGVVILMLGEVFAELRLPVLILLLVSLVGAFAYVNPTVRRTLRFDSLLAKLPLGDKFKTLDEAILLYSRHPFELVWATLLSLGNHTFNIVGVFALGVAFGVSEVGFWDYMALVPVANIVSSVPIAPGGWGVGELAFRELFLMVGASATLGVAVSVTFRLCQMSLGLLGGLFLLLPGERVDLAQMETETVSP